MKRKDKMSKIIIRGRPVKAKYLTRSKTNFDIDRFRNILARVGGDPNTWSLKDEWQLFSKSYFETSYVREKQFRSAY